MVRIYISYLLHQALVIATSCYSNATTRHWRTDSIYVPSVHVCENEGVHNAEKGGMLGNGTYQSHIEQQLGL